MRWLWIDRIDDCQPGVFAQGTKTFTGNEFFFADHFPGLPIVPGVLQVEMMAQLAGKCAALARPQVLPVLGSVKNAKFYQNIRPGDHCVIKVKIVKLANSYVSAEGSIEVDHKRVSSASILFGLVVRTLLTSEDFDLVTQDWKSRQSQRQMDGQP